jgi:UDP-N-acetylmuramoyl-tripeptide--D-alanyl-D-alanine ligase
MRFRKIIRFWLRFFSHWYIVKYQPIVIGITGNTGKTSTKESIYRVLKQKGVLLRKTPKNLNTDIGVPLAILGLSDARRNIIKWLHNFLKALSLIVYDKKPPQYLILELAADRPGEIEYFTKFLPIKIGVLTAIGKDPVHLEFFPNRDKLIDEKSWLVRGIGKEGTAILNRDDKDVIAMGKLAKDKTKILSYGKTSGSDLLILKNKSFLTKDRKFYIEAEFKFQKQIYHLKLPEAIGNSNLYSAMPALLCGFVLGVSIKDGIKALEQEIFSPPGRMKIIKGLEEVTIIDDTYNASPLSYHNALTSIADIDIGKGRKILIMGDMAELGEKSLDIHKEILERALDFADIIICLGEQMSLTLELISNLWKSNLWKSDFQRLPKINIAKDHQDAINITKRLARKGDIVLVKGAQVMRMEKIVKALMKSPEQAKTLLVRQEKHWLNDKT